MNQVEDKVMSNKALFIPLIMALFGLQAGLQTASGQDSNAQASPAEAFYTLESMSTSGARTQGGSGTESENPQACGIAYAVGTTGYNGIANVYPPPGCYAYNAVCSTSQNDWPHRITAVTGGGWTQVLSWAPWLNYAAGPIWYTCHAWICC